MLPASQREVTIRDERGLDADLIVAMKAVGEAVVAVPDELVWIAAAAEADGMLVDAAMVGVAAVEAMPVAGVDATAADEVADDGTLDERR